MLDVPPKTHALQRSIGRAEIGFGAKGLKTLFQSGCAKMLLPKTYGPFAEAVLVNTAGGMTGGDRFEVCVCAHEGAQLSVSSQTAERIYRSNCGAALMQNTLDVGAKSYLEWLPQETILFDGSALSRTLNVNLAENSKFLALETLVLGRKAMGEVLQSAHLSDLWRIRRGGKLIYGDGLRFGPELGDSLELSATFGGEGALATLIYVAPDAQNRLEQARSLIRIPGVEAAASAWNGMLVVRFLAAQAHDLRSGLMKYLVAFRGCNLPRVWHI